MLAYRTAASVRLTVALLYSTRFTRFLRPFLLFIFPINYTTQHTQYHRTVVPIKGKTVKPDIVALQYCTRYP